MAYVESDVTLITVKIAPRINICRGTRPSEGSTN